MAYISTEEVAAIRKQLKAEMPEYKFSVKKNHHSSVTVAFMKGPAFEGMDDHEQLNHYHAEKFYGKKNAEIINKVEKIIKTAPATVQGGREWFDESDSMTDYFHTAFYMSIHVGQWDKPYQAV